MRQRQPGADADLEHMPPRQRVDRRDGVPPAGGRDSAEHDVIHPRPAPVGRPNGVGVERMLRFTNDGVTRG